jgi:2,3-diphosphopglycerate-independent phosphoglycerate mutase
VKQLVCLLQGISDAPLEDLGGVTPFAKAHHPHFDQLEKEGSFKKIAIPNHATFGLSCERSLLALLGVDVNEQDVSKGPLEAYALGYALAPHQQAFSLRFMSVGQETIVDVSDELVADSENSLLCKALHQAFKQEGMFFFPLQGSQAVLLTTHPALCSLPRQRSMSPVDLVGRKWKELITKSSTEIFARIQQVLLTHEINSLREEMEEQPINAVWLSEQGSRPKWAEIVPQQKERCQQTALFSQSSSSLGIARILGIKQVKLSPEIKKYEHLSQILSQLDALFIDTDRLLIELPYLWDSTYKGDLLEKIKSIEWLDRHWVAPLIRYAQQHDVELIFRPLTNTDIREGKLTPGEIPIWCNTHTPLFSC